VDRAVPAPGLDLPDALQGHARVFGELERGRRLLRPRAPQVVAPAERRAVERVLDTGQEAVALGRVVPQRVCRRTGEVRTPALPLLALGAGGEQEHAFGRSRHEQHLALAAAQI